MFLPLIVASLLTVGASQDELAIVRSWIADVTDHQPGTIDKPLLDVATLPPANLDTVRRVLRDVLKVEQVPARNDILRRGAMVHTDIALLLPERAAEYLQTGEGRDRFIFDPFEKPRILYRRDADALVFSLDGEYVALAAETAHWSMARMLLRGIYPHPSADEFVRL